MKSKELLHENKQLSKPKLLHLDLETSSICNFNCKMCPRPKENGEMSQGDIKRIIEQFADQGGETIKLFWRGEPFADKRMPHLLEYANFVGLRTMINTNGSDPHGIYKDCLPHIDWISFSIDEQHNNYNAQTMQRVTLAASEGIYAEVQATKYNKECAEICEINEIPYKVDKPTKRSESDDDSDVLKGERKYCGHPSWRLIVSWSGDCILCCVDWKLENKVGNIYESSLEQVFYGEKATELREELKENIYKTNICKNCTSRSAYES